MKDEHVEEYSKTVSLVLNHYNPKSSDESKFKNPALRFKHLKEQTRLIDEKEKGHRAFWFTTEDKINWQEPQTILDKIWQTPLENDILSIGD